MTKPNLIIGELDAERLDMLLEQPAYNGTPIAQALNAELDRAEILPAEDIPSDVVTMNSRVRFRDLTTDEVHIRTLVFPNAMKDSKEQLSVMAPMGAAILGLHVGDTMTWQLPNGAETRVEVLALLQHPETVGEHHR